MPKFQHGDIETVDMQVVAEAIEKLTVAGMDVFPTDTGELEKFMLEQMGLPTVEAP